MRNQVKDFQNRMEEQQRQSFQNNAAAQQQPKPDPRVSREDYIDFEEIK